MSRKWTILAVVVTAVTLTATGLSFAADEESPMHKLMEEVNKANNAIRKATRTAPAYKKAQKEVAKHTEDIIALAKKAREMKESAEKEKKPFAQWQKLTDDLITEAQSYHTLVSKAATTQEQAKKGYVSVAAKCSACHEVFRIEDE